MNTLNREKRRSEKNCFSPNNDSPLTMTKKLNKKRNIYNLFMHIFSFQCVINAQKSILRNRQMVIIHNKRNIRNEEKECFYTWKTKVIMTS